MTDTNNTPAAPAAPATAPAMSYSERGKKSKEDRNLKIPTGRYKGPIKSFECKPNGAGNMMMTIGLVPSMCLTEDVLKERPDIIGRLLNKKKEARLYLTLYNPKGRNPHGGMDRQIEILMDAGYNVDQCRPFEQDPNYEDFKSLWHQMINLSPQVTFDVKWKDDNDQFPQVTVIEVEPHPTTIAQNAANMHNATEQMAAATPAPAAPEAPAAAPEAPAAPAITKAALRTNGWTEEQINNSEHANAPEA